MAKTEKLQEIGTVYAIEMLINGAWMKRSFVAFGAEAAIAKVKLWVKKEYPGTKPVVVNGVTPQAYRVIS